MKIQNIQPFGYTHKDASKPFNKVEFLIDHPDKADGMTKPVYSQETVEMILQQCCRKDKVPRILRRMKNED
jgi:hypothetical protein